MEFHSTGAATLKDLDANVLHVVLGISSLCDVDDLKPGLVGRVQLLGLGGIVVLYHSNTYM